MDSSAKSLDAIVIDWIASAVDSQAGWTTKREHYRTGVVPEIDPLYSWIDRAWRTSQELPSLAVVKQRWSRFPWPVSVLPESFAQLQMEQAYRRYDLISHVRDLDRLLVEGTTNEAYELTQQFVAHQVRGSTPVGIELTDPVLYIDDETDVVRVPSWGQVMEESPIGRGDMVLLTARTAVGKSWMLLLAAIDALRGGWDVVYYSLEMSVSMVAKRMRALLEDDGDAIEWFKHQRGHLHVVDQRMGGRRGLSAGDVMRRVEQGSRTLVIIDYGELLRPESGGRSTENHSKSAEISQAIQNTAKFLEVPILVAVQDNRAAVLSGGRPGVENLSGSDQWGRDADLVLRLRDVGGEQGNGRTRTLEAVKARNTALGHTTYFDFSPGTTGIRPIDRMEFIAINGGA